MKDLFSQQSTFYAKYRPTYPQQLFDYIISFTKEQNAAWDCATGNGQAAAALAEKFTRVEATDISKAQLKQAIKKPNINYSIASEETNFDDNSFDLITVAQAYHWLNWEKFHDEATRVGKNDAVVAIWAYSFFNCDDEGLNLLTRKFYFDIVGPYWDPERKYVDEEYKTVEFNFQPLSTRDFEITVNWDRDDLKGYLTSWSSVQNFIKQNNVSPLTLIEDELQKVWEGKNTISFRFPIFLKIGRIEKPAAR